MGESSKAFTGNAYGYHCLIRAAWRTSSFVDVEIARPSAGTCAPLCEPCPDRRWCVRESLGRIASGCASHGFYLQPCVILLQNSE